MDPAFHPEITNINGINLSDYFPDKSSYNPIVYIHKRYLPKENEKCPKNNTQVSKSQDKSQQFGCNKIHDDVYKSTKVINLDKRDPLLEQTIQFAKDIIPLTIPPSTNLSPNPVYYTIKSNKKSKRKHETCVHKTDHSKNATLIKDKSKHHNTVQHQKCKRTKVSHSTEESISRSTQNNTIDDINDHRSLCCSLSEMSEQKNVKDEIQEIRNRKKDKRVIASESFEAIATEYMNIPSESKIKINLMNEKDKRLFCERISNPIVKTINELLNNQKGVGQEMLSVQKVIEEHANKLDNIIEKLSRIENKIDKLTNEQNNGVIVKNRFTKTSKLEEIGKDILEVKENFSSEEELAQVDLLIKRRGTASITSNTSVGDKDSERERETGDDFAKGENIPEYFKPSTSQFGMKPERPNRLPARFCWTDAAKTK